MSKKTLSGGQLAGGNSASEREKNDFYATDPETVKIFLNAFLKENVLKGNVLEPACGNGNISKTLEETGLNINITSTDLIDRDYGQGNIDFITYDYGKKFDTVITNPPFSLAKEFIEKGEIKEGKQKYFIDTVLINRILFKNQGIKEKNIYEELKKKCESISSSTTRPPAL